jgi:chorismate lyase/3-hydroxybenzoate synthase
VKPLKHSPSLVADRKVSEAVARLTVEYVRPAELPAYFARPGVNPMAIIAFDHVLPHTFSCSAIAIDLPQIDQTPLVEVWTSDRPTQTCQDTGWSVTMNGDLLVGSINLDEKPGIPLDLTAYMGYGEVIRRLHGLGYPYLWRVWNYFPRINEDQDGLERYRRFCVGRYQALNETLSDFPSSLPAATAVGTRSGPLQIVFLAATQPAIHLGNPRQLNAYEYPSAYGPRSPSFARATFTRSESGDLLLIAGTASVVGHASRHVGLPREQTKESLRNLYALMSHAKRVTDTDFLAAQHGDAYKVYVRSLDALSEIRQAIEDSPLAGREILFLQGDLCRKELLVEIEGLIVSD